MARLRSSGELLPTSVTLPEDLKARLQAAADAKGVKLAAEIRDRLEASFAGDMSASTLLGGRGQTAPPKDPSDEPTLRLIKIVQALAIMAKGPAGRWAQDPWAMRAFSAGLAKAIEKIATAKGKPVPPDNYFKAITPEQAGHFLAEHLLSTVEN